MNLATLFKNIWKIKIIKIYIFSELKCKRSQQLAWQTHSLIFDYIENEVLVIHHYGKISDKNQCNRRRSGFILAHDIRIQSSMAGMAWWLVCKAAGESVPLGSGETMYSINPRTPAMVLPIFSVGLPSSVKTCLETSPRACLSLPPRIPNPFNLAMKIDHYKVFNINLQRKQTKRATPRYH